MRHPEALQSTRHRPRALAPPRGTRRGCSPSLSHVIATRRVLQAGSHNASAIGMPRVPWRRSHTPGRGCLHQWHGHAHRCCTTAPCPAAGDSRAPTCCVSVGRVLVAPFLSVILLLLAAALGVPTLFTVGFLLPVHLGGHVRLVLGVVRSHRASCRASASGHGRASSGSTAPRALRPPVTGGALTAEIPARPAHAERHPTSSQALRARNARRGFWGAKKQAGAAAPRARANLRGGHSRSAPVERPSTASSAAARTLPPHSRPARARLNAAVLLVE